MKGLALSYHSSSLRRGCLPSPMGKPPTRKLLIFNQLGKPFGKHPPPLRATSPKGKPTLVKYMILIFDLFVFVLMKIKFIIIVILRLIQHLSNEAKLPVGNLP
jgi:hypothetical protein